RGRRPGDAAARQTPPVLARACDDLQEGRLARRARERRVGPALQGAVDPRRPGRRRRAARPARGVRLRQAQLVRTGLPRREERRVPLGPKPRRRPRADDEADRRDDAGDAAVDQPGHVAAQERPPPRAGPAPSSSAERLSTGPALAASPTGPCRRRYLAALSAVPA